MVRTIEQGGLVGAAVVNINVQNCEIDELAGWGIARVGVEPPRRMSAASLVPKEGHEGAFNVKMEWGDAVELPADTDGGMVDLNQVAVSYLMRLEAQQRNDLTLAEEGLRTLLG